MAKTRSQATPTKKSGTPTKKAGTKKVDASPSVKKVVKKAAATATPKKVSKKTAETPVKVKATTSSSSEIVPSAVASKAISELVKFVNNPKEASTSSDKKSLFDDEDAASDEDIFLQIITKKYYSSNVNLKPKQIQLSHSIKPRESIRTCLIIRDLLITTNEQLEKIEGENFETLKQIIPMKDLKKEYKPYEKKRQLHSDYDLFLVDDACLNMLPQALGKVFYGNGSNAKAPIAVRVTSTSKPKEFSIDTFKNQLNKVLTSTSFLPPVGVNISIKFGGAQQSETEIVENLFDVLKSFSKDEIRSVMVKTSTSPALPLYYTDKLYTEEDVKEEEEEDKKKSKKESKEIKLSAFEKGLLELGDADEVAKIIGKKLGEKVNKKKVNHKVAKK